MKNYIFCFLLCLQFQGLYGQQVAPNFTLIDVDGNSHELYEYLDQGKSVILDFYAVWCGPCQQNAAGVEKVWEALGPEGTDEIMILGLEVDDNSTDQDVFDYAIDWNCNNPQINNTENVKDIFGVTYYPTYLVVCPDRTFLEYTGLPDEIEGELLFGVNGCSSASNAEVDSRIFDYNSGIVLCSDITTPNFTLMNMGSENLTTVEILTYLNGDLQSTTNWSGDLALYEFEDVSLPSIDVAGSSNSEVSIVLENPNNSADANEIDNSIQVEISSGGVSYETDSIHFQLYFDNFPQETTWEILNSIGTVVFSGGDYIGWPDFSPPIDTFLILPSGDCYTFNIYDAVGDGICCAYADPDEGFWKLLTADDELIAEGGMFTYEESAIFGIDQIVDIEGIEGIEFEPRIFPNPTSNYITIENVNDPYTWEIISLDGQSCLIGTSLFQETNSIDLSHIDRTGIYLIKIETAVSVSYQKVIIER